MKLFYKVTIKKVAECTRFNSTSSLTITKAKQNSFKKVTEMTLIKEQIID